MLSSLDTLGQRVLLAPNIVPIMLFVLLLPFASPQEPAMLIRKNGAPFVLLDWLGQLVIFPLLPPSKLLLLLPCSMQNPFER